MKLPFFRTRLRTSEFALVIASFPPHEVVHSGHSLP